MERFRAAQTRLSDPDDTLTGWGFDPIFFDGRRMVAADLDRVSATRPVLVIHQNGHLVNVNSEFLRRAGISRETNVQGVVRDASGEPTGELQSPALRSIAYRAAGRNHFLDMGRGEALRRFADSARRAGVTTAAVRHAALPSVLTAISQSRPRSRGLDRIPGRYRACAAVRLRSSKTMFGSAISTLSRDR